MVRISFLLFLTLSIVPTRGQTVQFENLRRLSSLNSSAEEGAPLLSPDGEKLFFTRALYEGNEGGEYAGEDIWVSERRGKDWLKPSNSFASLNNKRNNVIVGVSRDGKSIYFVEGSRSQRMNGVHVIRRNEGNWARPELLYIPGIDNLDYIGFYVSPDEDVIFLSMRNTDSHGNEDLYYSIKEKGGTWTRPRNLGATVNTKGFEISPFLSADKKRLYFASDGHKGEGDADIFYSERLYESWEAWSVPVNLGPAVNSKKFDGYFSMYGDSIAFFTSNRDSEFADIYSAKVTLAKTILAKGQHYLSGEEMNSLLGKNVVTEFKFPHGSSVLTDAQKELVFYIVNKLMLERDIQFHLVVREEDDSKLSSERLSALAREVTAMGIDAARVVTEQVSDVAKTQRGLIELRLFR